MDKPLSKLASALGVKNESEIKETEERKRPLPWYSHRMLPTTRRQLRRRRAADAAANTRKLNRANLKSWRAERRATAAFEIACLRGEEAQRGLKPGELQQALIDSGRLQGRVHTAGQVLAAADVELAR